MLENNRLDAEVRERGENPLKDIGLQAGKIKHVIYIVKENRTYDQVLGDLPQGNGDPKLRLFGREVTPNQHAMAERFVLMDNFYDCGEVSGDGWTWSTQAMANEYTIRNVPYSTATAGASSTTRATNNELPDRRVPRQGPGRQAALGAPGLQGGRPSRSRTSPRPRAGTCGTWRASTT